VPAWADLDLATLPKVRKHRSTWREQNPIDPTHVTWSAGHEVPHLHARPNQGQEPGGVLPEFPGVAGASWNDLRRPGRYKKRNVWVHITTDGKSCQAAVAEVVRRRWAAVEPGRRK